MTRDRRLWTRLLRIGLAAGRGTPGDRLRWWALFAVAATVALVVLGTVAAVATHQGREQRNEARGPILTDARRDATLMYREVLDTVDDVQHSVLYLVPLTDDAPLPPGLSAWPEPGQAVLSPELAARGRHLGIHDRYGESTGTIGKDGLAAPSERLAYVRPARTPGRDAEGWWYAEGFGRALPIGEMVDQRPVTDPLLTFWALTGVPALALSVIAARVGSRTRDRRSGLLHALGAGRRHRALVQVGEAAAPLLLGTLLMALPQLAASRWDLRLPPTGYVLDSRDIRAAWPAASAGLLLSVLFLLAVVVLTHRAPREGRATRPGAASSSVPPWRPACCGLGVALVVTSQYLPERNALAPFALGTVLMWGFLPSVAALVTRRVGAGLAARGARTGRAGQLIGGRWTAAHPGVVVRLALAMVIGLGIVAQLQVWNSRLGEQAELARLTQARIGDGVLAVQVTPMTPRAVDAFARTLPDGAFLLKRNTTYDDQGRGSTSLQGSCRALRSLDLGCPAQLSPATGGDRRIEEIRRWSTPDIRVRAVAAPFGLTAQDSALVIAERGRLSEVKRAAFAVLATAEPLGDTWASGAAGKARANNWVLLYGVTGLAVLALTGGLGAAAEFVRIRGILAPLTVLTGTRSVFRSVAFWHLTLPLLVATVLATAVTAWHSLFFIAAAGEGSVSWTVLAAGASGCVLVALLVGALGARSAIRATRSWRPTAD
ncbi:permease [Streptomyces sp. NPDC058171]